MPAHAFSKLFILLGWRRRFSLAFPVFALLSGKHEPGPNYSQERGLQRHTWLRVGVGDHCDAVLPGPFAVRE